MASPFVVGPRASSVCNQPASVLRIPFHAGSDSCPQASRLSTRGGQQCSDLASSSPASFISNKRSPRALACKAIMSTPTHDVLGSRPSRNMVQLAWNQGMSKSKGHSRHTHRVPAASAIRNEQPDGSPADAQGGAWRETAQGTIPNTTGRDASPLYGGEKEEALPDGQFAMAVEGAGPLTVLNYKWPFQVGTSQDTQPGSNVVGAGKLDTSVGEASQGSQKDASFFKRLPGWLVFDIFFILFIVSGVVAASLITSQSPLTSSLNFSFETWSTLEAP